MTNQTDETIKIQYVVEAEQALQATKKFRDEVNRSKADIRRVAVETRKSFSDAASGIVAAVEKENTVFDKQGKVLERNSAAIKRSNMVIRTALKEVNQEQKEAAKSADTLGSRWNQLGTTAKYVFGSIIGVTVFGILRSILSFMGEAAKTTIEFSQSIFKLGASTRALQRAGLDITLLDVSKRVEELRKEFGIFSRQEIVEGLAQVQLYTRQLGFTVEQQDAMIDSVAALSVVMGKDFLETARSVALFLASGYGEALQRAGIVEANRASLAQRALAMGINKSFNEMTQQERALVGLQIIMEGVADITEETAEFQEKLAGQAKATTAAWEDMRLALGQRWEEAIKGALKFQQRLAFGIEAISNLFTTLLTAAIPNLARGLAFLGGVADETFRALSGEGFDLEKVRTIADSVRLEFREKLLDFFGFEDLGRKMGEDVAAGFEEGLEEGLDVSGIVEEIADKIESEWTKLNQRIAKAERDLQRDLARIDRDIARDREQIVQDSQNRIADIVADTEVKIAKAQRQAAIDATQINRQFNLRRDQVNRKFRERELKAERDFQEKMRRLREEFLFDLEDALRERDARQVIRLTQRFQLEQDRLKRERTDEKSELDRQRKTELENLEAQRQERLRVLQEELAFRIQLLREAGQREIAEEKIAAQERQAELDREADARKEERKIRHQEQLEELEQQTKDRLELFIQELDGLEGAALESADVIIEGLNDRFGSGSPFDKIIRGVISRIQQLAAVYRSIANLRQKIVNQADAAPGGVQIPDPKSQAEGGIIVARQPTTVTFGEAGAEVAEFTPLNRLGRDEGRVVSGNLPGFGSGRGEGRIRMLVELSPGLEASIVEESLGQVADVILNNRRRRL